MACFPCKARPTSYPRGFFYSIRIVQGLSALVLAGAIFYFIEQLKDSSPEPIPKMFYLMEGAAIYTLITIFITSIVHCLGRLSANVNATANSFALILWIISFALLIQENNGTVFHACKPSAGADDLGVSICYLYKVLFAFSLIASVSTFAAFTLDVIVYKRTIRAAQKHKSDSTSELFGMGGSGKLYDPHGKGKKGGEEDEEELNGIEIGYGGNTYYSAGWDDLGHTDGGD